MPSHRTQLLLCGTSEGDDPDQVMAQEVFSTAQPSRGIAWIAWINPKTTRGSRGWGNESCQDPRLAESFRMPDLQPDLASLQAHRVAVQHLLMRHVERDHLLQNSAFRQALFLAADVDVLCDMEHSCCSTQGAVACLTAGSTPALPPAGGWVSVLWRW